MSVRQTSPLMMMPSSFTGDFDSEEEQPSDGISYKRYIIVAFSVLFFCGVLGIAVTDTNTEQNPANGNDDTGETNIPQDVLQLMAKPASESWSFDFEPAPHRITLPDGTTYDPFAVPALYSDGCEDTPGWTNGFDCSKDTLLTSGAQNTTFCKKSGYTCAAYGAFAWHKEKWALGPFANYPERNCCVCGGGTTIMQLTAECGKASETCAKAVQYAMYVGIRKHPKNYPGLSKKSNFDDVQKFLHENEFDESHCSMPCSATGSKMLADGAPVAAVGDSSLDSNVIHDIASCPKRQYLDVRKGSEFCFAQLADNEGVKGLPCSCKQGCDSKKVLVASTNDTVTFKNMKGLSPTRNACARDVILTIPRDYYKHWDDVKESCGRSGLVSMFELIMRDAWAAYNNNICKTDLWQCFHSPRTASVKYIHMQSFPGSGFFHAMPTSNHQSAVCVKQTHVDETEELAIKLAAMIPS